MQENCRVIVSMTSIPSRMHRIAPIIRDFLHTQTFCFSKFVLSIPSTCVRQKKNYEIPDELYKMQSERFQIVHCEEDDGPATKIIPAMELFYDVDAIVSVDDDIYLEKHALEELVSAHLQNKHSIFGFMGVVGSHFFHAEQLSNIIDVSLLGGYRAILYPQSCFRPFLKLFHFLKKRNDPSLSSWPLTILDDDYMFSQFARISCFPLKVIPTRFFLVNRLNIVFDSNSDGVSGQPLIAKEMQASRHFVDTALEQFVSQKKQNTRLLHIVTCSQKQATSGLVKSLKTQVYGTAGVRFLVLSAFNSGIHIPTVVNYLKCLFHPTIRANKQPHKASFVLISHASSIVDVQRVLDFVTWYTLFGTKNKNQIFPTPFQSIKLELDAHVNMPILIERQQFLRNDNYRLQNILPMNSGTKYLRDVPDENVANTICFHVSNSWQIFKHLLQRKCRQICSVFYGPTNITDQVHRYCAQNPHNFFKINGTNAQMDVFFTDPKPYHTKFIKIIFKDGFEICLNQDWCFFLNKDDLFC